VFLPAAYPTRCPVVVVTGISLAHRFSPVGTYHPDYVIADRYREELDS